MIITPRLAMAAVAVAVFAMIGYGVRADDDVSGPFAASSSGPSPTPIRGPASPPATRMSGVAETSIGRLSWTKLRGDTSAIPAGDMFRTPSGYAAIESESGGRDSRFWTSSDGLAWEIAPLPVPARGAVAHGEAAGEHWIWSMSDFRLWHSSDFETWTEVDMDAVRPPTVEGIEWGAWSTGTVTAGATTLLPFDGVFGQLALDDLLGVTLEPGEITMVGGSRDAVPELGRTRDVFRLMTDMGGGYSSQTSRVRIGAIRVSRDGSIVTVEDAERGVVVAEIDAALVGVPAEALAEQLHANGRFDRPVQGARISGDVARPLEHPPGDLDYLAAVGGRFVALANEVVGDDGEQGNYQVWASPDGIDWEALGAPVGPSRGWHRIEVLRSPGADSSAPLVASVMIDEPGKEQRLELWASTDGRTWESSGVVYTYPEPGLNPVGALHGAFLAIGDDYRIHVSPTGAEWSAVDGPEGVGQSVSDYGGSSRRSVTSDAAFIVEVPIGADRVMWVLKLDEETQP